MSTTTTVAKTTNDGKKKSDLAELVKNNTKDETKLQKLHKAAGASDVSKCPYHKTMNFGK